MTSQHKTIQTTENQNEDIIAQLQRANLDLSTRLTQAQKQIQDHVARILTLEGLLKHITTTENSGTLPRGQTLFLEES